MTADSGGEGAPGGGPRKISDAWIFVSHSHRDLNAVRRVRDEFERLHGNPLLFFLMCLTEDEEVSALIKREIAARNFFLLCDSPAARISHYVQLEREFVLSLKDRKIHEIDLSWPWERQREVIYRTLQSATTFINYASLDRDRARPYIDLLIANDFAVFEPSGLGAGTSWVEQLSTALERSVMGYFFSFLSQNWLRSRWVRREIEQFLALAASMKSGRPPFLVALDPISSLLDLPEELRRIQILDFSDGDVAQNKLKLLKAVELVRGRPEPL